MPQPRGLRNNNPLNIRRSNQPWRGKWSNPTDPDFEQFISIELGIRAAIVIVRRYIKHYRLDTPAKIINRWAHAVENDTAAYIDAACRQANLRPDARIRLNDKHLIWRLLWGMAFVECGQVIPFHHFETAWALI